MICSKKNNMADIVEKNENQIKKNYYRIEIL